jgi:hypothetical protein
MRGRQGKRNGIHNGQSGSITFVQRFGGSLNVNPHFHVLIPDGLFVPGSHEQSVFAPLPPPEDEDIQRITKRIAKRLGNIARRRIASAEQEEPCLDDPNILVYTSVAEALQLPRSPRSSTSALDASADDHTSDNPKALCSKIDGFSLHAERVIAPHDRKELEKLCRYGLRAPFALDRIEIDPEGNVRYRLLRPWTTPTSTRTHLTFDPLAFLRRLAALIPSPYQNLVRYHGVFANRSKYRSTLPLPPSAQTPAQIQTTVDTDDQQDDPIIPEIIPLSSSKIRPRRMAWAQLLKRVLNIDVLSCAKCKVLKPANHPNQSRGPPKFHI